MVTGQVQQIQERQTAMGVMYNIKVGGEWYGLGSFKPSFAEGANISFDYVQKGNFKNVTSRSIEVGVAAPAAPAKATRGAPSGNAKDDYWAAKEERDVGTQRAIQLQASRNAAIAFIVPAAVAGLVKLPAKAEDKLTALSALVDEFTDIYFVQTQSAVEGTYSPQSAAASVPFDLATAHGDD